MESQFLKQLVTNQPEGSVTADMNAPFSFLEWRQRRPNISEKDSVYHYNRYVIEWFEKNKEKQVSKKFFLRQKYIYLLNQLQVFFTEEEKNNWYNKVNLADEKELLLAIPYFAKKLKSIALYYLKLRKQLKNTKLKYNTVGTQSAVERELYSYLLQTFTTLNSELSTTTQSTLPTLSALQDSLTVTVEEIYDDKNYFDHSPTMPVSAYFNLFDAPTQEFFATKGIILSSSEWLFDSLTLGLPTSSTIDNFVNSLTATLFESTEASLYGNFVQTYLSENKYLMDFTQPVSSLEITDIAMDQGNNYFYYPYGVVDTSISFTNVIPSVALSSIQLSGATAGMSPADSDTIFVKVGNELKSAWLWDREYTNSYETVNATLQQNSTTSFIFPFPGYGLSGQDIGWTGPAFNTTGEYNFLPKSYRNAVNGAYWSSPLSADSIESILLNNTTITLSTNATSNINPQFADQVYIRTERATNTDGAAKEVQGAWLYRFEKTAIPIAYGQNNVVLWPYAAVSATNSFPTYLQNISYEKACDPEEIQSVNSSSFIASDTFDYADKIFRLGKYSDPIVKALECIWLSGNSSRVSNISFVNQDGFNGLFNPGTKTRFVWAGPNNTSLNSVFKSILHQKDCAFETNYASLSNLEWQKCSCKQVYYTPLGHPGRTFQDYNGITDCIIKEDSTLLEPFDFGSWQDSLSSSINSSTRFAWYKTKNKHSWGNGQWVSNVSLSTEPFRLQYGKTYIYYRTNSNLSDTNLPAYNVNYSFNNSNKKTVWVKGKLNSDGTWSGTNQRSDLRAYPGDLLKVDRQPQTTSFLISSQMVELSSENRGNIWSSFDWVASDFAKPNTSQAFFSLQNSTYITWPLEAYPPLGTTDTAQYPQVAITSISNIDFWYITQRETNITSTIRNTFGFSFSPPAVGIYDIAVQARLTNGQTFIFTAIPAITAIDRFNEQDLPIEFGNTSSGFLIEHDLKGWNYSTNKYSPGRSGARPYWAVLYTGKDASTKYKGLYSWGYPSDYINNYLPNRLPRLSPLELNYGYTFEYLRHGDSFVWKQPIEFKKYIGTPLWCELSANTAEFSVLSSVFLSERRPELMSFPKKTASDIVLTNVLNGLPVEVYYYANNSFVWPVSVETALDVGDPTPQLYFNSPKPWANLGNRFFPTIAVTPVLEEIYTMEDVGGYFLPQNLGASQYINKDFVVSLSGISLSANIITEDTFVHIGGRGNSKQDQDTIYTWEEQNQWIKEPSVMGKLAGAPKKSLTKKLQTFIPYQNNSDETALGLVNTRSRVSPWGGYQDQEWTDINNEPKSFTGVRNVSAWTESQVLKQNEQVLDGWSTDVYGNQYGLFKQLSGVPTSSRKNVFGELWTRTNNQIVLPSSKSLSAVFLNASYERNSDSLYSELMGVGIKRVDCFFDTLMVETSSAVSFIQIDYDYETTVLTAPLDTIRGFSLDSNLAFDQTWFFPKTKKVVSLFTAKLTNAFLPKFYELDLDTRTIKQTFPTQADETSFQNAMEELSIAGVSQGTLHYNDVMQTYLISYTGKLNSDKAFICNIEVQGQRELTFKKVDFYIDENTTESLPPIPQTPSIQNVGVNNYFELAVSASNNPTSWTITSSISSVSATNSGVFYGTFLNTGLIHLNYTVANDAGSTNAAITFNAT